MQIPADSESVRRRPPGAWSRNSFALGVVACLLALAAANISMRARWHEVEDGVLWVASAEGVVAAEIAPRSAAAHGGLRPGDLLLAIDGTPVDGPATVVAVLHRSTEGSAVRYTVLRRGAQQVRDLSLQLVPQPDRALYFVLAAIAILTLLAGAAVRVRRPTDPATLHFFWLSVAFFGVFAFSFSGRLDRLDWVFYWADVISILALPPLFAHFALVFPDRPHAWIRTRGGRVLLPLTYAPAVLLGLARVNILAGMFGASTVVSTALGVLDRLELVYLAAGLVAGLVIMVRALGRVRSVVARRQLRWIVWGTALGAVPFVAGYVVPYVTGVPLWSQVELLAIPLGVVPLAFASAVARYRLMDVEVIVKRAVAYAAAVSAIAAIYAVILKLAGEVFLGADEHNTVIAVLATLVVVLLAPVVKSTIQTTLDRAHYRDRYDYRRALVAFARDLNSDLDLERLSAKLVDRVRHTLALERMALLMMPAGGSDHWVPIHAEGFEPDQSLHLDTASGIGARLQGGHAVSLDDPLTARRFTSAEVDRWRGPGVHCFVPCVSKGGAIAVMALGGKESGEPLSSEDMSLLLAVAGQVATALENGRLYQQLRTKADELNRLRQFSENVIASLTDGLVVIGLDDRVLRWNAALEEMYGVARAAAVGRPLGELFEPAFVEALHAARHDGNGAASLYRVPLHSRHAAGARTLLVNATATPLKTLDGAVAGTILIIEDTTTRVRLEEQLQISDKMASIGLLAAGVAHEVNTPLTGISSYTQMLLEGMDRADPRTRLLETIERQTFRAAKIVNGLLNLARPTQIDAGPVDLHAVINDVLALLEHQLRSGSIQLRRELASDPPVVLGLEHKLQQVFLNLFINARDAMPKGGWLSIATRNQTGAVVVEISDTGSGIPTDQLSRIYDPFFTTKPIGKGTGLGLSITYGIVQEHGGTIGCESTVGQGTRFTLTFPTAARERGRSEQAQ